MYEKYHGDRGEARQIRVYKKPRVAVFIDNKVHPLIMVRYVQHEAAHAEYLHKSDGVE